MIGAGVLFAYFLILVGFGMMMMPGAARQYGLLFVPDIESRDPRRGFQCFSELFAHAVAIMGLSFSIAYLMMLQNLYLRVAKLSVFDFLAPDFTSAGINFAAGRMAQAVDDLIGNAFCEIVPTGGLLALAGRFAAAFIPLAFLGVAFLLLRASALRGRTRILREIEKGRANNLMKLTDLPATEIKKRLGSLTVWPLSWPSLRMVLVTYALMLSGLVFYKIGFLMVMIAIVMVAYVTLTGFQLDED
jgi:hypothetical protein